LIKKPDSSIGWGATRIEFRRSVCGKFAVTEYPEGIFHVEPWPVRVLGDTLTFDKITVTSPTKIKRPSKSQWLREAILYRTQRQKNQKEQDEGKIFESL